MGFKNDYIYNPTGNLILASKDNREIWTLRGKQEGRFTVNLHLYSCRIDNIPLQLYEKIDVPVVIELVRLNPYLNTVTTEVVTLNSIWDEKTAFSFVIDKNGYIRFERNFIKLVKDKRP